MMGTIADTVMAEGGEVIGIIPEALAAKEVAHHGLTELHIVGSMHERKAMMAELSDGFIAMPGGVGTFEEFCEVLTWAQLGEHAKPCGLLDIDGYYAHLLAMLDHAVDERFLRPEHRSMLIVETKPVSLLDRFAAHRPPKLEKWIDRSRT